MAFYHYNGGVSSLPVTPLLRAPAKGAITP